MKYLLPVHQCNHSLLLNLEIWSVVRSIHTGGQCHTIVLFVLISVTVILFGQCHKTVLFLFLLVSVVVVLSFCYIKKSNFNHCHIYCSVLNDFCQYHNIVLVFFPFFFSSKILCSMFVYVLFYVNCVRTYFVLYGYFGVWWLACRVNRRQIEHLFLAVM